MHFQHPEGYDRLLRWQDHPTLPLRIYNYTAETQYSGAWDHITLQCRGLVVDTNTNEIVAWPISKFFNLSELPTRGLTLPTCEYEVLDKADGQLIIVFWYDNKWHAASRGSFTSPYAQKAQELFDRLPIGPINTEVTYLFELVGFERIVVQYSEPELILIGARRLTWGYDYTHRELTLEALDLGCKCIKKFDADLDNLPDRDNAEGFVIRFFDKEWPPFRVKVKYNEYVRLHKLMTGISSRDIWQAAKEGTDILTLIEDTPDEYYDWVKDRWNTLHKEYKALWYRSHEEFTRLHVRGDNKASALAFQEHHTVPVHALYALMRGKREAFESVLWDSLEPLYEKPFSFNQLSQIQHAA